MLIKPSSCEEIKRVVFSFNHYKAPDLDGIHPLMYQKYWSIMGGTTITFCKETFTNAIMDPRVNTTYLCLIPKCTNATRLGNFIPISLCNIQYKIITKIITNRLRPFLSKLISPSQFSFLLNRRTSDNAIIIQEIINHFMKMNGKRSNMILKKDLEKSL